MFGLMRPEKKCGKSCHDWTRTHRMHYCGTCKAIGTQYGHQARLFLNFDIVFLSELLSDLNNEKMDEWTDAYQSINRCFSMPTEVDNTPFSLQYTATANTILSALKVDDNIKDQKQFRWYATRKFYARSFRKAFEQMEAWGTPKESFFHWIDLQIEREESIPKEKNDLLDYLSFYAEPTAELTALIFEEGVKKIKPAHQQSFRNLGYNFGLLMYILDAFEDLENDIFTKQFNPLIHWFDANKTLEQGQLADVRHIILQLQHKVCEGFKELPLKEKTTYSARLVSNIALRIYRDRYIPTTRKERIKFRWEKAKDFAEQIICAPETNYSMLKYYLVTSSIFLMPRLVNQMPKRADKIDWEWSAFWAMVLPFSVNSTTSSPSNQNPPQEEEKERHKIIACCCCFSSFSVFPITQCFMNSKASTPTGGSSCSSGQGGIGKCPLKDGSCNCDCGNCGGCCCDSRTGNRDCRDCCCDGGNSGGCCSGSSGSGGSNGGNSGGGGSNGGNDGGAGSGGSSGSNGGNGGGAGSGGNSGSNGGNDGGAGSGSSGGDNGGGDCCSNSGGGSSGCCDGNSGGGSGGGGGCCCEGNSGGGSGGGGGCCCDGNSGGGSGGGGDCCCDGKGGGGGGGGGDCCCDGKGGGGGGGGGGCCCDGKGGGGGGGGGGCCCDGKGGGGGGGGGGCCCDGKGGGGGGGGGGCCCDGKGGGGGGGGGGCCCDGKGGGGGGGCCCDGKGGGGGGGCCCDGKGGGGGGGGGGCCCDGKGGGGGGGGGGCCCDGKGGGGGGGCCCDGKGGGGGGGGCDCCKVDAGGFDLSAPAHFESCSGVFECFFPWHC